MAQKPSTPKGTRDFSPQEMLRRKYIFNTIEKVFRTYGFLPLETPAMENLSTLTGKYGEEGDRLIFKVLNSGDWTQGLKLDEIIEETSSAVVKEKEDEKLILFDNSLAGLKDTIRRYLKTRDISEKALRYDLTVPFARYVVQHQNEITFPFKRYQIQPVWRADRPQKGRYREFYQCDADVIGSTSLLNEVDLTSIMVEVFSALGLGVVININHRGVLTALAKLFNAEDRLLEFITVLDKLDKGTIDDVVAEYRNRGFSEKTVNDTSSFLQQIVSLDGDAGDEFDALLRNRFTEAGLSEGIVGLDAVHWIQNIVKKQTKPGLPLPQIYHSLTLARGLDYYTGTIFEVKAAEGTLKSSICGGGRYDDLTGIFGLKNMSGVGISFGADRIYDVLLETEKFPAELGQSTRLLFANFGEAEALHCLKLLRQVRDAGIAAELYPDQVKMAKQFKYADDKGIPFVAIIGENEMKQGIVTVKDMKSGEQKAVKAEELISMIS